MDLIFVSRQGKGHLMSRTIDLDNCSHIKLLQKLYGQFQEK